MTGDQLTAILAERVMGWRVGDDRFLMRDRGWLPSWRFQPLQRLEDAFRLLEKVSPQQFTMETRESGDTRVRVQIGRAIGEAQDRSKARAITLGIARAIGLGLPDEALASAEKVGQRSKRL